MTLSLFMPVSLPQLFARSASSGFSRIGRIRFSRLRAAPFDFFHPLADSLFYAFVGGMVVGAVA